jgi:hypothetical protein
VDDFSGPGEAGGAVEFVDGEVGDQAEVGAFAHHGGPAVAAGERVLH